LANIHNQLLNTEHIVDTGIVNTGIVDTGIVDTGIADTGSSVLPTAFVQSDGTVDALAGDLVFPNWAVLDALAPT